MERKLAETQQKIAIKQSLSKTPNVRSYLAYSVKTARKDQHVIAKAGDRVIAERASKVVAYRGSYVVALDGSKVIATVGSEVLVHEGSTVINPYGKDDHLSKITVMPSPQPVKRRVIVTDNLASASLAGGNGLSDKKLAADMNKGIATQKKSNGTEFAFFSKPSLETQLASLSLVYHSYAAIKNKVLFDGRPEVDRRKFVGRSFLNSPSR